MLPTLDVSWNVMLIRLVQLLNALCPMLVTLFGIVMLVRLTHLQNALRPISVTFDVSWNVMLVRPVQP